MKDFWDELTKFQKRLTVIATIIAVGVTFYTGTYNVYNLLKDSLIIEVEANQKNELEKINDKLDYHEQLLIDIKMDNLKQKIWNKDLPLSERVLAGEEYCRLGGNGATEREVERLFEEYINKQKEDE